MKFLVAVFGLLLIAGSACAQDAITPAAPAMDPTAATMTPPPVPGVAPAMQPAQYEQQKYAILQTLDKVTARTSTTTLPVGQPSAVGPIFIDVKTCQKTPQTEQPEAAAFLQVWEAKPKAYGKQDEETKSQWVFSGWMFASSPALSAMNHPIYDVWVKDCVNDLATPKQK
jgi:hypothetical protein